MSIYLYWIITLKLPNETLVICENGGLKDFDKLNDASSLKKFKTKKEAIFYARHTLGDASTFDYERLITWRNYEG